MFDGPLDLSGEAARLQAEASTLISLLTQLSGFGSHASYLTQDQHSEILNHNSKYSGDISNHLQYAAAYVRSWYALVEEVTSRTDIQPGGVYGNQGS